MRLLLCNLCNRITPFSSAECVDRWFGVAVVKRLDSSGRHLEPQTQIRTGKRSREQTDSGTIRKLVF